MGSLADNLLAAGFDNQVLPVQGEQIKVLTGENAGQSFPAMLEKKPNIIFDGVVVEDNREKVIASFSNNNFPECAPDDKLMDSDGITWLFVSRTVNNHDNTTDFELRKWVDGVDN